MAFNEVRRVKNPIM